ncbi:MAG: sigma-54 dependent transcriptional regulator [Candidatus Zixiibacteriota bacterium]
MIKVLIIDDGNDITNYCHQFISDGFEYDHIRNGIDLSTELKKKDYGLILLDKSFTKNDKSELLGPVEEADNEGLRILKEIRKVNQSIPVIMVTANADYDSMSSALHMGAFDYVEWDALQKDYLFLKLKMERAIQWEKSARTELVEKYNRWGLIGRSEPMVRFFQQMETTLDSDSTLLLRGETGTGKDLVARIIHDHGPRSGKAFVSINCAAIPSTLLERELLGHEKGAYTDAKEGRAGKFELADGGTIFLNEIGEIPRNLQAKLLKVVEDKQVDRIGASKPVTVDVRIISATNREIEETVEKGDFRADLYYRLKVLDLRLPPLKRRMEDLPLLIDHFIALKSETTGKEIAGITQEASGYLCQREWVGNVRELENLIEKAVERTDRLITLKDLLESKPGTGTSAASPHDSCTEETPAGDCPVFRGADMNHIEKVAIINALKTHQGMVEPASQALGISKATMYNKIKEFGLSDIVKGYMGR